MTWADVVGLLSVVLNVLLALNRQKLARIIKAVVAGVEAYSHDTGNERVKRAIQSEATTKGVEVKLAKIVKAVTE